MATGSGRTPALGRARADCAAGARGSLAVGQIRGEEIGSQGQGGGV